MKRILQFLRFYGGYGSGVFGIKEENRNENSRLHTWPKIFNLNIDCIEGILEYLSLEDINSFGQTCRHMHKVTGAYFKRNYASAEKVIDDSGIYTIHRGAFNRRSLTKDFNQFHTYISQCYHDLKPFYYLKLHANEFECLNHIYMVCLQIDTTKADCIKSLLPQIETLQIRSCSIRGDFYGMLLAHCKNLKRLYIQEYGIGFNAQRNMFYQRYPNLVHLEMTTIISGMDLNYLFVLNSNIRSFSTSFASIWYNKEEFLKAPAKLDLLEVKDIRTYCVEHGEPSISAFCELLNELYDNQFYQRLYFYIESIDEETSESLTSLKRLQKLCIKNFTESFSLPRLTSVRELAILNGANAIDMEFMANGLVNLQRFYIENATFETILPFIRYAPKLGRLMIFPKDDTQFDGGILNLLSLNRKREQLIGATKVTIFVPDNIFLNTKWTINNGARELNLVEMWRTDSYEWNQHF